MIIRSSHVILTLLFILGVSACSPALSTPDEATPTFVPTPVEPYHPLTTRTGMEEIDPVLEAVASADKQALISLVQFTQAKCTHAEGLGGPPKCREGEAEGTPMEVLPFLGGEGSYLRKEEIQNWQGIDVSALYAVYEVDSSRILVEEYFPAGEYVIILVGTENRSPVALRVTDGKLVRVDELFEPSLETLDALIQREASKVILAPKN